MKYTKKSENSLEKKAWRYSQVSIMNHYIGAIPEGTVLVDMAANYTMNSGGKRIVNPDSFIGLVLALNLAKPHQIITIDSSSKVVKMNDEAKTGIRNICGDFFKVVKRLVKEGVKISFIDQDMMCMGTNKFAAKQAKLMKILSTQSNLCAIALNLCVRAQMQSELKNSALDSLRGFKPLDQALRKTKNKAGIWHVSEEWEPLRHRYISSRTPYEQSILIKEKNPDYVKPAVKHNGVELTPGQQAWKTRMENTMKNLTAGKKAWVTRRLNLKLAA